MEKTIADFQQRKLQIDFVEFVLIQNRADDPISYRGTGYIRQTADDVLTFTLYAVETLKHLLRKTTTVPKVEPAKKPLDERK